MKTDKKLSLFQMAIFNLKAKKFRTAFMIFFVVLMSSTFFFSTLLMNNLELGIKNTTEKMGADIIVAPKDGTEGITNFLFSGNPCSIYMSRDWAEAVKEIEGVEKASPQLYLATLDASCCDAAVQLIAYVPETDFVVTPWLKTESKENISLERGEVVIGSNVNSKVGDPIRFYETEFKVAAKLEPSGMGYDNSVFMTFETAYMLKDSPAAQVSLKTEDMENEISMVLVDMQDDVEGMKKIALQRNLEKAMTSEEKVAAYTTDSLLSGISKQVKKLSGYGNILTYIMVVSTALALICIFVITINERKYEFGILYTLGAKKSQIIQIILSEAMLISVIGAVLGIVLAGYGVITFRDLISIKLDIPYLNTSMKQMLPVATTGLVISIITGMIAAVCSAYKMGKGEPYRLIRESES